MSLFFVTKLDANGNSLPASATTWSCVRDNVTGLVWEAKTDDGGLQDTDNRYSWYNPDPNTNGGNVGVPNGSTACTGSNCDTYSYVQTVNALPEALCGQRDWRMPWIDELQSIVDYSRYNPSIDTTYFPLERSSWIWSGSTAAKSSGAVWYCEFHYGAAAIDMPYYDSRVRLVRDGQ